MVNTANDVEAMYRRVDFEDWGGDAPSDLDGTKRAFVIRARIR